MNALVHGRRSITMEISGIKTSRGMRWKVLMKEEEKSSRSQATFQWQAIGGDWENGRGRGYGEDEDRDEMDRGF